MRLGETELIMSTEDLRQAVENYLNQICLREDAPVHVASVDKNYEKWMVKVSPKPDAGSVEALLRAPKVRAVPLVLPPVDSGKRSLL